MLTFTVTETHGCCIPSTWLERRLSHGILTIDIVLLERVSDLFTLDTDKFMGQLGTVGTKGCQDNLILTKLHLLLSGG